MKKLLNVLLIVGFGLALSSCVYAQDAKMSPIEFNNYCAEITSELYEKGKAWGTHFAETSDSKNFSSLKPFREAVTKLTKSKIAEFEKLKGEYEPNTLVVAMLDFLKFEHNLVTTTFEPFEKFDAKTSDETIQNAVNNLIAAAEEEGNFLTKLNAAQKEFAQKHGFQIQETEGEGEVIEEE